MVKNKASQSYESAVYFDLLPDIINDNCKFYFFNSMAPKAAILYSVDTPLLSNLDKPWYLSSNEHNSVPIPIPAYDYSVISRSLLCDCHLQGGNELLNEFLASCYLSRKGGQKHISYNYYAFCLPTTKEF